MYTQCLHVHQRICLGIACRLKQACVSPQRLKNMEKSNPKTAIPRKKKGIHNDNSQHNTINKYMHVHYYTYTVSYDSLIKFSHKIIVF